jgi:uncharacterized membrane protein
MTHETTGQSPAPPGAPHTLPPLPKIDFDGPWRWLAMGWADVWRSPGVSLTYGALFAAMGCLLTVGLFFLGAWYAVLPLAAGFMLVGPLLAVGLYEISRRHAAGETPRLSGALTAWRRNPTAVFFAGLGLALVFLLWIRLATLLFALFYGIADFHIGSFFAERFFSAETIVFLVLGIAIGAVLATIVFSVTAVTFPMIVDKRCAAIEAGVMSVRVVAQNWRVLALWAALITAFSIAGLICFYIGLIFVLPLVGHASWHAYRELTGAK